MRIDTFEDKYKDKSKKDLIKELYDSYVKKEKLEKELKKYKNSNTPSSANKHLKENTQGLKAKKVKIALTFFGIQLALNVLWSVIFFGLNSPLYAFIEIIILWIAILLTILKFHKVSKAAAYLLIPYLLWVSFAVVLNLSIFLINL